ncbi:hypothetical protein D3C72_1869340 [compost metagenome]
MQPFVDNDRCADLYDIDMVGHFGNYLFRSGNIYKVKRQLKFHCMLSPLHLRMLNAVLEFIVEPKLPVRK